MPRSGLAWLLVGLLGLALGGCMQATLAPSSDAQLTPKGPAAAGQCALRAGEHPGSNSAGISSTIRTRRRPGSILLYTDARYLYYVMPGGKAIRYGVAVGEEALAFSGV